MAEKLPGFLQPEPPRRFHLAGKPELSVLHRAEIPKHEIIVLRIVIAADIPHVQDFQPGFLAYLPESGLLGVFTGGVTGAAGGIAAAIVFGCLFALLSRPQSKS